MSIDATIATTIATAPLFSSLNACSEAREWAFAYPSLADAWAAGPRGDWMLWLAARLEIPRPVIKPQLIACPVCRGSGRNPEAPAELVDDDGTCLVCCFPLHPLYAAHHGHVWPIP